MIASSSSPNKSLSGGGGGGSSSSSSSGPAKKVRAGALNQQQPARCQVDGCQLDLSNAKAYYSRHKVCGNHSKSPLVTVKGIEQRFCQQCSRFHLLPEFDQGKRSCRRRLAGHNERRRKPPNGPLLSPRCSRLSSSTVGECSLLNMFSLRSSPVIFFCGINCCLPRRVAPNPFAENRGQISGFLLDFSAQTKIPRKDPRQLATSAETFQVNRTAVSGEIFTNPWHNNSETPSPPDRLTQTSKGFANPADNCYVGDSDSSCALSLLSYQPWGSRSQASPGRDVRTAASSDGALVGQSTGTKVVSINEFSSTPWGSKGNEEDSSSSLLMRRPDMGMGQPFSQSTRTPQVSSDLGTAHLAYVSSSQQMYWPL